MVDVVQRASHHWIISDLHTKGHIRNEANVHTHVCTSCRITDTLYSQGPRGKRERLVLKPEACHPRGFQNRLAPFPPPSPPYPNLRQTMTKTGQNFSSRHTPSSSRVLHTLVLDRRRALYQIKNLPERKILRTQILQPDALLHGYPSLAG
jgi:hypothetical protein